MLDFTADDMRRLDVILTSPPAHLSFTKLRQLRVAKALCSGEVGSDIAAREGIKNQRVSTIRKQIAEQTLAVFLNRLLKLRGPTEKKKSLRPHAGKPGHEKIDTWSASIKVDDEPIFELATLLLTPELQVAVIAIRESRIHKKKKREKASDNPEVEKRKSERIAKKAEERLRALLRQRVRQMEMAVAEPIFWTEMLNIDSMLAEAFQKLRTGFAQIVEFGSPPTAPPVKLCERYDGRFGHVIICKGPEAIKHKVVDWLSHGAICRLITVEHDIDFLDYIEAILCQRRVRSSSVGFLPLAWIFYDEVNDWIQSGCGRPFHWNVTQADVVRFLKYPVAVRDYFAIQGILFEIDPSLWTKIAHQDEVPFHILPLETRVELAEDSPQEGVVHLWIRPLPEIQYSISLPWSGDLKQAAKKLRQKMRRSPGVKRLVYSSRQDSDQLRTTVTLSPAFFEAEDQSIAIDGTSVVLLPRHFLTPAPNLPLEVLTGVELSKAEPISFLTVVSDAVDDTFLLFHMPSIFQSVRRAFEENWYGDKIRRLSEWQGKLMPIRLPSSPDADRMEFDLLQRFYKLAPDAPTFYFFREEHYGTTSLPSDVFARVEHLLRMRDGVSEHSSESDFASLLKNVDADFLLSGIDGESRRILDDAAEKWACAIDSIIASVYWPQGNLNLKFVKFLLSDQLQDAAALHVSEIESWCNDARKAFFSGKKLVIRAAIENMQRLILCGLPPCPVAVETEQNVLRRWRTMLSTVLNTRLAPLRSKSGRTTGFSEGKKKSNRCDSDKASSEASNGLREAKIDPTAQKEEETSYSIAALEDDVNAICDAVRSIASNAEEKKLRQFFDLAREIDEYRPWAAAAAELSNNQPDVTWIQRICRALELCRSARCIPSSSMLPQNLADQLRRIFVPE